MTRLTVAAGARRVLAWTVMLAVLSIVALAVVVPRMAGATPYVVLTGSMRPQLPPGTLVVVRPVPESELAAGDVITYQLRSGDPQVVTHRIVSLSYDGQGRRTFRTQGDANPIVDGQPVRPVQVRGELWYSVPWVGRLGGLLDPGQRGLIVMVLGWGLAGYAAFTLAGAARARASRRRAASPATSEPSA